MKKVSMIIIIMLITATLFVVGFNNKKQYEPNIYYQVYLDEEVIGVIRSQTELESYINKQGDYIKKKLGVKKVYAPKGLQIRKITTYDGKVDNIKDIYKKIEDKSDFTISGYQFSLKKTDDNGEMKVKKIFVTDKEIFSKAITGVIKNFVGENIYNAYIEDNQIKIESTGRNTENIYVDEDITIKETLIPTAEKIYTNDEELSQYLLFGENMKKSDYTIKAGETIEQVAFNNEISVKEFLMSNPKFTSANSLLFPGQIVNIAVPDPQLSVVIEEYVVEDQTSKYTTEEIYDGNMTLGDSEVRQKGENGTIRIFQRVKSVNGVITFVDKINQETMKPSINEIVAIGTKYIPTVGSVGNWAWPTNSGWTITSPYGWRIDPFSGYRDLHNALDIAGTGYGSNIYAATNGVVTTVSYDSINGYHVVINHNNGYYTWYNHMNSWPIVKVGQTVARGQVIGYIGSSGYATGPHLHFQVWVGRPYREGYTINPFDMY